MDPYAELVRLRNQRGGQPNPARRWFRIENHTSPIKSDVYIYDLIGNDPFFGGISAAAFGDELRTITAKNIVLHINSLGGDVFEGVAMRNALARLPATIETHIEGVAASTASWVGLGTNKVVMEPQSTMFIHEPFNGIVGDAAAMRKAADEMDMFGDQIAEMYVAKAGGTKDEWRGKMRDATWFTDQTAVAAKLADEVGAAPAAAQNSISNVIESTFLRLVGQPARPRLPRNAAGDITITADQAEQIDAYLDSIESNAGAISATADAIEAMLGIEDEPDDGPTNRAHPEARLAELIYLRDQSRRLGVA